MRHRRNAARLPAFIQMLSRAATLGGMVLLAACGASPSAMPTATVGATPTPTAIPATPTPSVALGPQACQGALASATWASLIPGFDATSQKIGTVTCGDLKRDGHQEALVPVQYDGTGGILDFYVFGATSGGGAPTIIFSRANATGNLYKGSVAISDDNTIISNEVDQNSCINRNAPGNAAYLPDLAREWRWNGSAFAQVAFPGIFPAFTRYGAQYFERQTVDAGSSLWALDPVQETNAFATQWLFGGATPGATLVSSTATTARTHVLQFTVSLQRLAYPAHPAHAIWVVTGVQGSPRAHADGAHRAGKRHVAAGDQWQRLHLRGGELPDGAVDGGGRAGGARHPLRAGQRLAPLSRIHAARRAIQRDASLHAHHPCARGCAALGG